MSTADWWAWKSPLLVKFVDESPITCPTWPSTYVAVAQFLFYYFVRPPKRSTDILGIQGLCPSSSFFFYYIFDDFFMAPISQISSSFMDVLLDDFGVIFKISKTFFSEIRCPSSPNGFEINLEWLMKQEVIHPIIKLIEIWYFAEGFSPRSSSLNRC